MCVFRCYHPLLLLICDVPSANNVFVYSKFFHSSLTYQWALRIFGMWAVNPEVSQQQLEHWSVSAAQRQFPDVSFLSHILKWKNSFFVASHESIFDINYFLSTQGHNNMGNDEYQVFFKGWHPASSTYLPRSDFLILRETVYLQSTEICFLQANLAILR